MVIPKDCRAWYAKSGIYERRLAKAVRNLKIAVMRPFVPVVEWYAKWLV